MYNLHTVLSYLFFITYNLFAPTGRVTCDVVDAEFALLIHFSIYSHMSVHVIKTI